MSKQDPYGGERTSYPQNWYPVMLSSELDDAPVGADFLGTRVVVFRRAGGSPVALEAYCPHLGADLSIGELHGDEIQCAFHHFRYGPDGRCTWVPGGCDIPKGARVFSFPAVDSLGMIWAFNGEQALFDPPAFIGYEDAALVPSAMKCAVVPIDPYVAIANVYDYLHLRELHGLEIDLSPADIRMPNPYVKETDVSWNMPGVGDMRMLTRTVGTNTMLTRADFGGRVDLGGASGTPLRNGETQLYQFVAAPDTRDGTAERDAEIAAHIEAQWAWVQSLVEDDVRVFASMKYRKGTMIAADTMLSRWLHFAEEFPHAIAGRVYDA